MKYFIPPPGNNRQVDDQHLPSISSLGSISFGSIKYANIQSFVKILSGIEGPMLLAVSFELDNSIFTSSSVAEPQGSDVSKYTCETTMSGCLILRQRLPSAIPE